MLFADSELVGTFKGFVERGLEFSAEIVAPYDAGMLDRPQLGQFLLVELANEEEAALGRITRFVPTGLLAGPEGEDYVNTMQRRSQDVPEDLKEQRLKYRVQIKLLGAVRSIDGKVVYVPSQRRLPHLGARVALPSGSVLRELCRLSKGNTDLGDYVLGEFVHCGAGVKQEDPALRSFDPKLPVTFNINNLVARRTVVFARAGYGKSNLVKFLVSELYRAQPATPNGLDVGTLIFDADGEYFWPDVVRRRPGLCDVEHLKNKIVVFTNRPAPSAYYGSWKAGDVKLDIRDLRARDVIGIAISPDRQQQQNVLKLKALPEGNWRALVDLVHAQGFNATDAQIGGLLGYPPAQIQGSAAEIAAARSNITGVVRLLHDPESKLLGGTLEALRRGSIVVIDISLLSSAGGNMLSGLLLRRIFSHNQDNFTGGLPIIPAIAIIEEAQSVLGKNLDEQSPFVEWVKEGRKYELGAVLITQQPGAMSGELLSQADNWFSFHLLSEADASTLGHYNSHFSDDILSHLIAEPIPGNCFMWSAPLQPFVLPVRVRSFEALYRECVTTDAGAVPLPGTRAHEISSAMSEATDRLARGLRDALKAPNAKFVHIPRALGEHEGIGIKSGQLYYMIKDIRTAADTASEEQLKLPLLKAILGECPIALVKHEQSEYYCASLADWTRGLGKAPRVA